MSGAQTVGPVAVAGQEALGEVVDVVDRQFVVRDLVVVLGVTGREAHVAEEDDAVGRQAQVGGDPFGSVVLECGTAPRGVEAHAVRGALVTLTGQARPVLRAAVGLGIAVAMAQQHEQVGAPGGGLHRRSVGIRRVDLAHMHHGLARCVLPGQGGLRDLIRPVLEACRGTAHRTDHDDHLVGGSAGARGHGAVGRVRDAIVGSRRGRPDRSAHRGHDHRRRDEHRRHGGGDGCHTPRGTSRRSLGELHR